MSIPYIGVDAPTVTQKKGVIGRMGTAVWDLIDVPGNVSRSTIAAVKFGDPDYLWEALKTVSPIHSARRVPFEELDVTDNPWLNLAGEIVTDPLMYVGSIGGLTRAGKLLNKVSDLRAAEAAFRLKGHTEKALKATYELSKAVKEFRKLKPTGTKGLLKKRSLIGVGVPFTEDVRFGDYKALSNFIARNKPVGLMPDIRKPLLTKKLTTLENKIETIEDLRSGVSNPRQLARYEKDLTKLGEKKQRVESLLLNFKPAILPAKTAVFIREQGKKLSRRFDPESKTRFRRYVDDITVTDEAGDLAKLKDEQIELIANFDKVRKVENLEQNELLKRLTGAVEARHLLPQEILAVEGKEWVKEIGTLARPNLEAGASKAILREGDKLKRRLEATKKLKLDPVKFDIKQKEMFAKYEDAITGIKLKYSQEYKQLREMKDLVGKLTPSELDFVYKWFPHTDDMVRIEQNSRIAISALKEHSLSYMKRLLSKQALALKKSNKTKYNLMINAASTKIGSAIKRSIFPERQITDINKLMREKYGLKYDFFDADPLKAYTERKREHIKAIHRAQTAMVYVNTYAKPGITGGKVWTGKKTKPGFLDKLGMSGDKVGDLPALDKNLRMPQSVIDDATKTDRLLQSSVFNDEGLLKALNLLDKLNAPFRILLTSPWPAFNNRNMISNFYLNVLGGVSNPKWYMQGIKLQHNRRLAKLGKHIPTKEELKWFKEIEQYRILGSSTFYEELFRHAAPTEEFLKKYLAFDIDRPLTGTIENLIAKFKNWKLTAVRETPAGPLGLPALANPMVGKAWAMFIEDNARIAHYLAKRSGGMSEIEAMRSVNKYLFDYSKLTNFEKQVMRPTFLFYTWMRKNIPLQLNSIIEHPRLAAVYRDVVGLSTEAVPDYLRASPSFLAPGRNDLYISSLGLPIEDLNLLNVDDVDPLISEQMRRVGEKIVSRTSPALRIIYETITGRTAFSRRPLRDMPIIDRAADLLPISRFYRTAEKVIDPEEPIGFRLLDALTGVRTYPVSLTRAQLDELKRAAIITGKFYRSGFIVGPKKKYKEETETQKLVKKMQKLAKKLRAEKARR